MTSPFLGAGNATRGVAPADRLWPRLVAGERGCMEWPGAHTRSGYGWLTIDKKMIVTHRLAWELTNGPIPTGLYVCHRCDNPPCCNPDHLFLGTPKENMTDMSGKGRSLQGSASPRAIFVEQDVRDIRDKHEYGSPISWLAREYNCGESTIRHIVQRNTWKHVD